MNIFIPADFMLGKTEDEIKEEAAKRGVWDYTISNDGSVTYHIEEKERKLLRDKIVSELKEQIEVSVQTDSGMNLIDISVDHLYKDFVFTTTSKEEFEESYGLFVVVYLYTIASQLHFVDGGTVDNLAIKGAFRNSELGQYLTEVFPEAYIE